MKFISLLLTALFGSIATVSAEDIDCHLRVQTYDSKVQGVLAPLFGSGATRFLVQGSDSGTFTFLGAVRDGLAFGKVIAREGSRKGNLSIDNEFFSFGDVPETYFDFIRDSENGDYFITKKTYYCPSDPEKQGLGPVIMALDSRESAPPATCISARVYMSFVSRGIEELEPGSDH